VRLKRSSPIEVTDATEVYDATGQFQEPAAPEPAAQGDAPTVTDPPQAQAAKTGRKLGSKAGWAAVAAVIAALLVTTALVVVRRDAPRAAPRAVPRGSVVFHHPVRRGRADHPTLPPRRVVPARQGRIVTPRRRRSRILPRPAAPPPPMKPRAPRATGHAQPPVLPRRRVDADELPGVVEPAEGPLTGSHVTGTAP